MGARPYWRAQSSTLPGLETLMSDLMFPTIAAQTASGGMTEFERTSPDAAASRAAASREKWAGYGETGARTVRDAAALTLATLLTRGAGGGQGLQALSRIGTSGGLGMVEQPGSLSERAERGALHAGGTGAVEAVMGPGMRALMLPSKLLALLKKGSPAPNVGTGIGTGFKAADFAPTPTLYDASGRPVRSKVTALEHLEGAAPRLRQVMETLRQPPPTPPSTLNVAGKIAGSTAGTEYPEETLGALITAGVLGKDLLPSMGGRSAHWGGPIHSQ